MRGVIAAVVAATLARAMKEKSVSEWVIGNLGVCRRCMHQSFVAALLAAAAAAVAWAWFGSSVAIAFLAAGALGLTLLWIAHVVAYAARTAIRPRCAAHADAVADPSRRTFLPAFVKTAAGVALATALPATLAMADCEGDCNKYFKACMGDCSGAGCLQKCASYRTACLRKC